MTSLETSDTLSSLAASVKTLTDSIVSVSARLDTIDETIKEKTPEATVTSIRENVNLQDDVRAKMANLHLLDSSPFSSEDDEYADKTTTTKKMKKSHHDGKSKSAKKSGRSCTADDVIAVNIDWPHYHCYQGPDWGPARYEDLSIPEFVFGYLSTVLDGRESDNTWECSATSTI